MAGVLHISHKSFVQTTADHTLHNDVLKQQPLYKMHIQWEFILVIEFNR